MPTNPTYPGVYIEEVPSSVRTIVGVATARTAFLGRALRGPLDHPVRIKNFGDYERRFGGLWRESTMSYAVQQYFQNGGSDAVIVRVANAATPATLDLPTLADTVDFAAKSPAMEGALGNSIRLDVLPSSNPAHAKSDQFFDFQVSAVDGAGVAQNETYSDVDLAGLEAALAASDLVEIPAGVGTLGSNGLLHSAYKLAGGKNATRDRETFFDATGAVLILEAVEAGDLATPIKVTIESASNPTDPADPDGPIAFNLIVKQGGTGPFTLEDVTLATLKDAIAANNDVGDLIRVANDSPAPSATRRPVNVGPVELTGGTGAVPAKATAFANSSLAAPFALDATDPGAWGNRLRATVRHEDPRRTDTFNLTVEELDGDKNVVRVELHLNLSVDPNDSRRMDQVLATESALVRYDAPALPAKRPLPLTEKDFTGGFGGFEIEDTHLVGSEGDKTGLYALENEDLFNILCIPPPTFEKDVDPSTWAGASTYCLKRRAMLLVDPPIAMNSKDKAVAQVSSGSLSGLRGKNTVFNFPRFEMADPLMDNRLAPFAPCGVVAGLYARTDAARGIWKAPAGQEARLVGVQKLTVPLTDLEHGDLNPLGLNCARRFSGIGAVMWGARTSEGADQLASQWKYIPVRRTALYIEESLFRGTQWVVFEPNDEPLWSQIRLGVGAFMDDLFRKGAFQGGSAKEAYFVKCDAETNPQSDIDKGIVNILVGFAPLKPAEFVIIKLSQIAKQGGA